MTPTLPDRRLLLVHAHPDDESIQNGVTMAKYAAEGAHVTLVTCTLGEEGEVLVPGLEHLASDQEDTLGRHRIGELADAMKILGVTDHRFLGGPGRYRDTGMASAGEGITAAVPATVRDDSFWMSDLLVEANDLVPIIREVRPQVLITYDEQGGYSHPDHIQAHRVSTYGATLAAIPSYRPDLGDAWDIPKIYWTAQSENRMRANLRSLRDSGEGAFLGGADPDGPLPSFVVADDWITTELDGERYVEAKLDAMRAHRTQILPDGPFFAVSEYVGNHAWAYESYRIVKGAAVPAEHGGLETDLFAGLIL